MNAIRVHFRDWVMNGSLPPPSLYPTLRGPKVAREDDHGEDDDRDGWDDDHDDWWDHHHGKPRGFLVEPTKAAMGFPDGIPELPATVPEAATITSLDGAALPSPVREVPFINPVLDYKWGPLFNPSDGSGVPTNAPPPIKQVIKMLVPRVDPDGNELGGVPVVLRDAPLGSYFGWNITAAGFHKDQNCDYTGGMVPFAQTQADRMATGDPRLSLRGALRRPRRLRAGGDRGREQRGGQGLPACPPIATRSSPRPRRARSCCRRSLDGSPGPASIGPGVGARGAASRPSCSRVG